jgi:acetylglutamate kinase
MGPVVVKLSGGLTEDSGSLDSLCEWLKRIREAGNSIPSGITLVHGGGVQINDMCSRLDIPVRQVAGRRVTDPATMEVLTATVGGTVNRRLVSYLRKRGLQAVGLTGADGLLTTAVRRAPLTIDGKAVDFGLVGEIMSIQPDLLQLLMKEGFVPVVACLTWSEEEGLLNINADTMAIEIAGALGASELVMLMQPEAVLDADMKPLPSLTQEEFARGVQDGWISAGMRPKLETGFRAVAAGIPKVKLTNPEGLAGIGGTVLT